MDFEVGNMANKIIVKIAELPNTFSNRISESQNISKVEKVGVLEFIKNMFRLLFKVHEVNIRLREEVDVQIVIKKGA